MILKIANALLIAAILASASMIYGLEYEMRAGERRIAQIEAQIAEEEATTRLLAAEWARLTSPERIEALAARHLSGLGPVKPQQVTGLPGLDARLPAHGPAAMPGDGDDPIADMLKVLQ